MDETQDELRAHAIASLKRKRKAFSPWSSRTMQETEIQREMRRPAPR